MRLSYRLSLVVVAVLVPLIAMEAYNGYALHQARRSEIEQSATRQALLASSELDRIIEGAQNILTAVAHAPPVRQLQSQACSEYLGRVVSGIDYITSVSVVDASGRVLCYPNKTVVGVSVADRPYFQKAMTSGRMVVGDYVIGRVSQVAVLPIALPIQEGGARIGAVIGSINLAWLSEQLAARGYPSGGSITLADNQGTIIARQPFPERFVGTIIPERYQYLLNETTPGAVEVISQDGTKRVLGYVPTTVQRHGLYVSAGLSTEASFQALNSAAWRQAAIATAAVLMALAAAGLISRKFVTDPINRVLEALRKWEGGDGTVRTRMSGREGEIGAIGEEVDRAIESANTREEAIKLLLRELAHRSKNQLTLVLSLARQLARVSVDVHAYENNLTEKLLALSRSQDVLLETDGGVIRIEEMLNNQMRAFEIVSERIRWTGPSLELKHEWAIYLSLAVHELATNSLKYGALSSASGYVDVSWSGDATGIQSLTWREFSDGAKSTLPLHKGFGTKLLTELVPATVNGIAELSFEQGLVWNLRFTQP